MTKFLKKDQLSSSWYEIDAKNAVVGRLATVISKIIRGKTRDKGTHKPPYSPLARRVVLQEDAVQRRLVAAEDRVQDPRRGVDLVEGRLEAVALGVLDGAAGRLLVVDPARVDGRHVDVRPREVRRAGARLSLIHI